MAGNIADWFGQHLARPDRVLYRHHVDDGWRDVTVGELATRVARWQAAFRRDGLAEGDRVALCGRNGLEWVAIDLAALAQGLVVVPLYVDDNPENVAWCVGNAEARLLIVENRRLAAGLARLAAAERIALPRVVVLRGDDAGDAAATPVDAFLPDGHAPVEIRALPPSALATICYTSGTVGPAEGRDADPRQHHRRRRRLPGHRHGAARRHLPVGAAAVAHVRAHRRLLPAAVAGRQGGVRARRHAARRRPGDAAPDDHVRGAPDLRALPRAPRAGGCRVAAQVVAVRPVRRARLPRRAGHGVAARPDAGAAAAGEGRGAGAGPAGRAAAAGRRRRRRARSGDFAHLHRTRAHDAAGLRHDRGGAGDLGESRGGQRAGVGRARRCRASRCASPTRASCRCAATT